MWLEKEECGNVVEYGWNSANHLLSFGDRTKQCGESLMAWDRITFGNIRKKIKETNERIEFLQCQTQSEEIIKELFDKQHELDELLKQEEIFWFQRSRALWLKDGDRNTSFFHQKASSRKRRNTVEKIKDHNGNWKEGDVEVGKILRAYFLDLFTSVNPCDLHQVIESVKPRVTGQMNDFLLQPYTEREIIEALKQMHTVKSPGPDGMPPLFFIKFWHIIKYSFISTCLDILNSAADPTTLNHTFVVLIPKVKIPETPKDFRPISLCNVIFRVITKVIANRVKQILEEVISKNQSSFIPNRLITDNAMVAFEIFHWLKKKKKRKKGFVALKLDMSNAYDRVEWSFLRAMCAKLGFHENWIELIMRCVSTVSYSLLVNGSPTKSFTPSRGLRQGDPLSPYLFLLCAEGFSSLIRQAESRGELSGIKIARQAPPVSHLLFADDSILFFKAIQTEVDKVLDIITKYESASGQRINLDKSEMTSSGNVSQERKRELELQLGARSVAQHSKYLGLPTVIGKKKKMVFQTVVDRVISRLKGWKEKSLTKGGREVLLKSVIQAIPNYAMSCFLFPKTLCEQIEKTVARFYWGAPYERKIHWLMIGVK